jgi:hypothetical protein
VDKKKAKETAQAKKDKAERVLEILATEIEGDKSNTICSILKKCVIEKAKKEEKTMTDEDNKKKTDIIEDITNSCKFYSEIDMLSTEDRRVNAPKFVINYVVTHSILPKTKPVDDIIEKVLFFKEYADMVTFNYITTDSRPFVASKLNAAATAGSAGSTGEGSAQQPPNIKNSITVMPIADVLANVLTDIDSPYIAPYIIPNVYPEPVAASE